MYRDVIHPDTNNICGTMNRNYMLECTEEMLRSKDRTRSQKIMSKPTVWSNGRLNF